MSEILHIHVQDGPQVGQKLPIPPEGATIGGKGSDADIELSGVPYGVRYAHLKNVAGKWNLIEFDPRSILLNSKPLKRKNVLKHNDQLVLPSLKKGQTIRLAVEVEVIKEKKVSKGDKPKINPMYLAMGGAYMVLMLLVVLYFAFAAPSDQVSDGPFDISQVKLALDKDIEELSSQTYEGAKLVVLGDGASDFSELRRLLGSTTDPITIKNYSDTFKSKVTRLFSDAWRLEQQERYDEAADSYQSIVNIMVDRNLKTTNIALQRLATLR